MITHARRRKTIVKRNLMAWGMLMPTFTFLTLFTYYPFIRTFVLSFYRKNLSSRGQIWNGIENYTAAFRDPVFQISAKNNLQFTLMVVPACLFLALVFAYLLSKNMKGIGFFRTALFYPNVSPMVGFALVWMFLLTPQIGFIDNLVRLLGGKTINWLGDPKRVLSAISFVYIWREAGYLMIFFLSGMQSISPDYYEAAIIDGANEWQRYFRITLPLLMPTMVFVLPITITNSIKMVDTIIVMTKGGPNYASSMIMYYIYSTAFSYWDQGMAATFSVIMMVIVLTIVAIQYFVLDKFAHYEN